MSTMLRIMINLGKNMSSILKRKVFLNRCKLCFYNMCSSSVSSPCVLRSALSINCLQTGQLSFLLLTLQVLALPEVPKKEITKTITKFIEKLFFCFVFFRFDLLYIIQLSDYRVFRQKISIHHFQIHSGFLLLFRIFLKSQNFAITSPDQPPYDLT